MKSDLPLVKRQMPPKGKAMLKKRIIPCLDVMNGRVVKGVKFANHRDVGDPIILAKHYAQTGADELVFYDITASVDNRAVDCAWIEAIAREIDIPFCVAGGIKTVADAAMRLESGADKISINTPAIDEPNLINQLVKSFGSQCIVIGIDSLKHNGQYVICSRTGSAKTRTQHDKSTATWAQEVIARGAGEIVLNCMNEDGVRNGYDIAQLAALRMNINIPLIASGGAGQMSHFKDVFEKANVDGALAASVFHSNEIAIPNLKQYLNKHGVKVRI